MLNLIKCRFLLCILALGLSACSTTGGRVSTAEGDAMMKTDRWTKVDSETAAQEIMTQLYEHPAWQEYVDNLGHKPKLFIKDITNNTADPYFRISELNNALLKQISKSNNS